MSDPGAVSSARAEPFVDWRAIVAGAVTAAGVSTTLLAFGSAVGLAVASAEPSWRQASTLLWIVSGLFLVFVALASFGLGGYAAGRMRHASRLPAGKEIEFRDGMHGVFTWGLSIVLTALLALGGAAIGAGAAQTSSSAPTASAAEGVIAAELDELFRTARRTPAAADLAYRRAEAARILQKTSSDDGVPDVDRAYLTGVVSSQSGLSDDDAAARVDAAIARSKEAIHRARVAAVLQAFMIAAALLLGAAVAWFSAAEGGRDRERGTVPVWRWSMRRERVPNTV